MIEVKENNTVKVHYTGKLTDGHVFDSSVGKEPLEFTMGKGQIIAGFEKGLMNMKVNEKKTITIPKEEAYGDRNESLKQEVNRTELPKDMTPKVGMELVSQSTKGKESNLVVVEVKKDTIIIDGNHPLAGRDITFDLEVVEIK